MEPQRFDPAAPAPRKRASFSTEAADPDAQQGTTVPRRFLRLSQVCDRTGLSTTGVYVRARDGLFPKPIKVGGRASRWLESEVDDWMDAQVAKNRELALSAQAPSRRKPAKAGAQA